MRVGEGGLEVLVVRKRHPDEWRLPKGKKRPGETDEQTAVREVREEAGVLAEIIAPVAVEEHPVPDVKNPHFKRTVFFLMRPLSPNLGPADDRICQACWLPAARAVQTLTFDGERDVVRQAVRWIADQTEAI